ncbi:hypothetical protein NDU88_004710 [Pleurodeles waltl]|uniref:Uncharacterized protein n=1 Tax=Pleurodeles waltl TaxID=8319 RepID=A0AAV7MUA2_PLEWA|nr:hypothetical protein NDU88_004710 [Pleurodeles waltl]
MAGPRVPLTLVQKLSTPHSPRLDSITRPVDTDFSLSVSTHWKEPHTPSHAKWLHDLLQWSHAEAWTLCLLQVMWSCIASDWLKPDPPTYYQRAI